MQLNCNFTDSTNDGDKLPGNIVPMYLRWNQPRARFETVLQRADFQRKEAKLRNFFAIYFFISFFETSIGQRRCSGFKPGRSLQSTLSTSTWKQLNLFIPCNFFFFLFFFFFVCLFVLCSRGELLRENFIRENSASSDWLEPFEHLRFSRPFIQLPENTRLWLISQIIITRIINHGKRMTRYIS